MKAKLVKESLNEFANVTDIIDLDEVREFIISGDANQPAPSKYDPDVQYYFIPHLSSEDKVFFFALVGGTDVYSIDAISADGTLNTKEADIANGLLDLNEIEERIQDMFPTPPQDMEVWKRFKSTEEYFKFLTTFQEDI